MCEDRDIQVTMTPKLECDPIFSPFMLILFPLQSWIHLRHAGISGVQSALQIGEDWSLGEKEVSWK